MNIYIKIKNAIKNRLHYIIYTLNYLILIIYTVKELLLFNICSFHEISYIHTHVQEIVDVYAGMSAFILIQFTIFIFLTHLISSRFFFFSSNFFFFNFKFFVFFHMIFFICIVIIFNFYIFYKSFEDLTNFESSLTPQALNMHFEAHVIIYFDFYYNIYRFWAYYPLGLLDIYIFFYFLLQNITTLKYLNTIRKLSIFYITIYTIEIYGDIPSMFESLNQGLITIFTIIFTFEFALFNSIFFILKQNNASVPPHHRKDTPRKLALAFGHSLKNGFKRIRFKHRIQQLLSFLRRFLSDLWWLLWNDPQLFLLWVAFFFYEIKEIFF